MGYRVSEPEGPYCLHRPLPEGRAPFPPWLLGVRIQCCCWMGLFSFPEGGVFKHSTGFVLGNQGTPWHRPWNYLPPAVWLEESELRRLPSCLSGEGLLRKALWGCRLTIYPIVWLGFLLKKGNSCEMQPAGSKQNTSVLNKPFINFS